MTLTLPFNNNLILSALPEAQFRQLTPHLIPMLLHHGDILCEIHTKNDWVYFPKSGVISMVLISGNGVEVEAGLSGREGVVGAMEALSSSNSMARLVVQIPGSGWRMAVGAFGDHFVHLPVFRERILRHQHSVLAMTAQGALCNRLHSLEERLSRWLLTMHDRVEGDELELTQEFIGSMLGTRRVGVTEAIGVLRGTNSIETHRGRIIILNRDSLEKTACECYQITRDWCDRI